MAGSGLLSGQLGRVYWQAVLGDICIEDDKSLRVSGQRTHRLNPRVPAIFVPLRSPEDTRRSSALFNFRRHPKKNSFRVIPQIIYVIAKPIPCEPVPSLSTGIFRTTTDCASPPMPRCYRHPYQLYLHCQERMHRLHCWHCHHYQHPPSPAPARPPTQPSPTPTHVTSHSPPPTNHLPPPPSSRRVQPGPSAMINPSAPSVPGEPVEPHPVHARIPSAPPPPLLSFQAQRSGAEESRRPSAPHPQPGRPARNWTHRPPKWTHSPRN